VYDLAKEGHDPSDMKAAFAKAIEWPMVQHERGSPWPVLPQPGHSDVRGLEIGLRKGPPVRQPLGIEDSDELMAEFL